MNESQLVELKNRLEHQESETRKDESKFEFSLAENEKLKTSFSAERTAWEKEKTILLQRAEAAEYEDLSGEENLPMDCIVVDD